MSSDRIWEIKLPVRTVLLCTTMLVSFGYIGYLTYALLTLEERTPSISRIIEYSKGTTITFTLLVFIHGYGVMSYLVIASEYIGLMTWHFYLVAFSCLAYLASLVVVSYIPIDDSTADVDTHSVFALLAFGFALLSSWLHRHSILNYSLIKDEWPIVVVEVVFIVVTTTCGALFWFGGNMIAEYCFIFFIIVDKEIKVRLLAGTGLLNIKDSFLVYSYRTPPSLINEITDVKRGAVTNSRLSKTETRYDF